MTNIKKLKLGVASFDTQWESKIITTSKQAEEVCRLFFHDDIYLYESFFLLLCNQQNEVISYVKISQGGVSSTVVDLVIVAKYAIDSLAKSVILCHNHPSGNKKASEADRRLTENIQKGLGLFHITVLDHIILTPTSYLSFRDEGIL